MRAGVSTQTPTNTTSLTDEVGSSKVKDQMKRFFFFSSRRRHTRLQGDWSSDVCSSDLIERGSHEELIGHGGKYAALCEQSLLESPREMVDATASLEEAPVASPDEQMSI